jgi:hypothetical protein
METAVVFLAINIPVKIAFPNLSIYSFKKQDLYGFPSTSEGCKKSTRLSWACFSYTSSRVRKLTCGWIGCGAFEWMFADSVIAMKAKEAVEWCIY